MKAADKLEQEMTRLNPNNTVLYSPYSNMKQWGNNT